MFISKIKKRDGRIVDFDKDRITGAIIKAFEASAEKDMEKCDNLANNVLEKLENKYNGQKNAVPAIEEIQDLVEETLIENGFAKVAKSYILYRRKREEIRKEKQIVLDKNEIDEVDKRFDVNALRVLKSRYLRKNPDGKVVESPKQLFERVALHAALPDILYDSKVFKKPKSQKYFKSQMDTQDENDVQKEIEKYLKFVGKMRVGKYVLNEFHLKFFYKAYLRFEQQGVVLMSFKDIVKSLQNDEFKKHEKTVDEFYNLMVLKKFLPNTPAIANFGSFLGMGSGCFALDVEDSIESIMDTLRNAAVIFKSGGGLGYNFSKLRPKGDFIKKTGGESSGPISFMNLFDTMTDVVKQGGIRRGANMGILNSNHPDIEEFITAKDGNKALRNFNISVLMMPDFWEYYKKDKPYPLINPRTGEVYKYASPKVLFDRIVYQAWESGEPGVMFYDHVNDYNPFFKGLGPLTCTNPCGEIPLYPSESCNLGSVNLSAFVKKVNKAENKKVFDWDDFEKTVRTATRFLDNVIDINAFPISSIEEVTTNNRKIGLGVMGLASMFYELEIPYNSEAGLTEMELMAEALNFYSKSESIELARKRGRFPNYDKSFYGEGRLPFSASDNLKKRNSKFNWEEIYEGIKKYGIRNSVNIAIAPTGSISMIAGCSSGIEPVYSLIFEKNVAVGSFYYTDNVFEETMLREGLYDENLIKQILENSGSVKNISYIPPKFKKFFVTAHDIAPEDHIKALAAFQKWVDSSISKTINFPADATVEQMKKAYTLAYELKCKDVTVFRDTSIKNQVLNSNLKETKNEEKEIKGIDNSEEKYKDNKEALGMLAKSTSGVNGVTAAYRNQGAIAIAASLKNNSFITKNGGFTNCPSCSSKLTFKEGCTSCSVCGWGMCS